MLVIKQPRVGVDVDDTLITLDSNGSLMLAYAGVVKRYRPIMEHIELLKHHKHNGYHITVWSRNEYAWALQVVKALKLENYVDEISSKMVKVIDDKDSLQDIVGTRVYLISKELK